MPASEPGATMTQPRPLRASSTTRLAAIRTLSMRSARDACCFVDELAPEAVGELVLGPPGTGAVDGAIFVERGRVCWSAARGLAQRLTDLLGEVAGLSDSQMEDLYGLCKASHVPLGEHLVNSGIVAPASLRGALLQHTSESLHTLCHGGARAAWIPREGTGYSPQFTFSTAEILTQVSANARRQVALRLDAELLRTFSENDWGAAFVREPESGLPEPVAVFGNYPTHASALLRSGKWAASVLDITATLSGDDAFSAAMVGEDVLVAFAHEDAILLGETSERGLARILNRRAAKRKARSDAGL